MKRILALLIFVGSVHILPAQDLSQRIQQAQSEVRTLSASFVQEKHSPLFTEPIVQEGHLYYKATDRLRWEYTSPQKMALVISNGKASLVNANGKASPADAMFGELGKMIVRTINGQNYTNSKDFNVRYETDRVVLTPKNKRLASLFKQIEVILDPKSLLADRIILSEATGDSTIIILKNKQINKVLTDSLFL